jgi:pimeloyl-ACP methyl ester carboxylesterase
MLVGNSLGGLFGLWFALDRPSRVARAVLVGQPAVAIAGSRANLTMVVLAAPVLGRVATWMARLPSPRLTGRLGLRDGAGAHAVRSVSDDIVDLHLLSMRLPGQAASFRSLLRRLLDGRTPRPKKFSPTLNSPVSPCRCCSCGPKTTGSSGPPPENRASTRSPLPAS